MKQNCQIWISTSYKFILVISVQVKIFVMRLKNITVILHCPAGVLVWYPILTREDAYLLEADREYTIACIYYKDLLRSKHQALF